MLPPPSLPSPQPDGGFAGAGTAPQAESVARWLVNHTCSTSPPCTCGTTRGGGSCRAAPKDIPPSDIVEIFDVSTKRWSSTTLPHARAGSSTAAGWLGGAGVSFFGSGGGDSGTVDLLRAVDMTWLPSLKTALVKRPPPCTCTMTRTLPVRYGHIYAVSILQGRGGTLPAVVDLAGRDVLITTPLPVRYVM